MAEGIEEAIRKTAEKIPGCCYISLVGYDGITIAQHIIDANVDVNLFDAEISSIMLVSREAKESLNLGLENELIWLTQKFFYIIHPIGEEFFLYACLRPADSNPGVARVELNKTREIIRKIIQPDK